MASSGSRRCRRDGTRSPRRSQGFKPAAQENILLELGQLLKVNLTLQVGGVTENVLVTAESPLIDVRQNSAGANVQQEIIDRVPKGRDFTTVITAVGGDHRRGAELRHPDRRRERSRQPLHGGRRRHDQPADRPVRQERRVGLRQRSAGQADRLQRRVPRLDWRRRQRHHQDGQQHVQRRSGRLLHDGEAPGQDPADGAPEPVQPAARRVRDQSGRTSGTTRKSSPSSEARS